MYNHSLAKDLEDILIRTLNLWENLRNERIFITGGTGFFGRWLLESLLWANRRLNLNASVVILTRTPERFAAEAPHIAGNSAVELLCGDIGSFAYPDGKFAFAIHGAMEAQPHIDGKAGIMLLNGAIEGTRRVLDLAVQTGVHRLLYVSSGAVYGHQPEDLDKLPETFLGAPDLLSHGAAYGEAKRVSELLCALYSREYGITIPVARCFAFVGPYLPLNRSFAVGNFIEDALNNRTIVIKSDGTARRSYLYSADLTVWLWKLLFKGQGNRPYNVGSDIDYSIAQVAETVQKSFGTHIDIKIEGTQVHPLSVNRYIPDISRIKDELELQVWTSFPEAVARTVNWYKDR